MNKLTLLALVACFDFASAKEPPLLPPPTLPLPGKVPDLASWTVIIKVDQSSRAVDPMLFAHLPSGNLTLKETRVVRGPKNKRITRLWSNSSTSDQWYCDGATLYEQQGMPDIYVFKPSELASEFIIIPNYSLGDFPELYWVSLKNFAGVKTIKGKPCYVFELRAGDVTDTKELMRMERAGLTRKSDDPPDKNNPQHQGSVKEAKDPDLVLKTAYLDGETKLPVLLEDYGNTHEYTFTEPPASDPQPPDRFTAALKGYLRSLEPPSPPPR